MDEKKLEDYILLHKKEYEQLIEYRTKAEQYKNYILENTNNNNLVKTMVTIERKNLFKLIEEEKAKHE